MAVVVQSVSAAAVNASVGTSIVITKPTGLAVGDLMIAFVGGPSDYNVNTATNWNGLTQGQSVEGNQLTMKAQWKIADAADVLLATFAFTVDAGSGLTGFMLRIDGHDPTTPINAQSCVISNTDTDTPSLASTITPTVANCLIILSTWVGDNQRTYSSWTIATSPPTFDEHVDSAGAVAGTSRNMSMGCASGVRPETTATGNSTVTLSGTGARFVGAQIAVAPSAGGGGGTRLLTLLGVGT